MRIKIVWLVIGAALLSLRPDSARALNFFELEAYPATTEGAGLHEIESRTTFVANGRNADETHRLLRTSLEYDYGLTDRIDVAAYLDLQKPNGEELEYAASRFRIRGALWDKGRFPVDLGWYFEAEVPHHQESDLEFEFRPLVSRDLGRFSIDLNPTFELPTVGEERRTVEFNYSARVYYRLSRTLQPALEFFGDIGQIRDVESSQAQQHYVFPSLYGEVVPGLKFALGPGFGVTRASDEVIVKFVVEYEFTPETLLRR